MDAPLNQAKLPTLILASASPRRSELLGEMGVPFTVVKVDVHEIAPEHLSPVETAEINAYRKARAVAKKHPDMLVLGADTVVSLGAEQFAKPADMADAERMLAVNDAWAVLGDPARRAAYDATLPSAAARLAGLRPGPWAP